MFDIIEGNTQGPADVQWFIGLLDRLPGPLSTFLDADRDVIVTRAPGRLDVMGGIADYSGSLVLEMPIAEATFAAIQTNPLEKIEIVSIHEDGARFSGFEMETADLWPDKKPPDLSFARDFFAHREEGKWASYVAGVFFILADRFAFRFEKGARIVIASRVPIGKGVSSSAALEVAAMHAVCVAYGIEVAPRDLALLCQTVENRIVGAACGVMDQITSHCGEAAKLTPIVCQPAEIQATINIPETIELWGIDSGVRHAVSGSDYSSVRTGAFMGYRIIADFAGLDAASAGGGVVSIDDIRWRGYLANISPEEYEKEFRQAIPHQMSGREFLSRYRGITDTVTTVDPARQYSIKAPTEHAIYENSRVGRFAELLAGDLNEDKLAKAGELMFRSHESYQACGLTEPRTDRIVDLVKDRWDEGLFGARITGGGSGGTVAVMARRGGGNAIDKLAERLTSETGNKPYIFSGSSPGCSWFGHIRLRWDHGRTKSARKVDE